MSRRDKIAPDLIEIAEAHGATGVKVVKRSKHPAISFEINGRTYTHVFSGTPSDHRSRLNVMSDFSRRLRQLKGQTGDDKRLTANARA